jgi:shikimate dehydrogenase
MKSAIEKKSFSGELQAGVMGWPIEHSLSPRLHRFWLQEYKIKGSYVALPVKPENLEKSLCEMRDKRYRGVNLTIPHKENAMAFIDHIDPLAKRIGAVNTVVVRSDGTLEGHNTDVYGFSQNLINAGFVPTNRPVVVFGAGGAARAAIAGLTKIGVGEIRIVNRSKDRAHSLINTFPDADIRIFDWDDALVLKDAVLLVNATSLGLTGQSPLEFKLDHLPADAWVNDMVYVPMMTGLLKRARERDNKIIDGLGMLLYQARPAFAAFFGVDPEVTDELRSYVLGDAR